MVAVVLLTLLSDEKTVALLESDSVSVRSFWSAFLLSHMRQLHSASFFGMLHSSVPRVLVVWREPRRVCRLGDFGTGDLLERVDALALGIEGVHKMHDWRFVVLDF